jgi:hypothetical protein
MMEKRKMDRYALRLPATIRVVANEKENGSQTYDVITNDVSAGGAFFETDTPLAEGTRVKIRMVLSIDSIKKMTGKQAVVNVSGHVLRAGHNGIAVCFNPNYRMTPIE